MTIANGLAEGVKIISCHTGDAVLGYNAIKLPDDTTVTEPFVIVEGVNDAIFVSVLGCVDGATLESICNAIVPAGSYTAQELCDWINDNATNYPIAFVYYGRNFGYNMGIQFASPPYVSGWTSTIVLHAESATREAFLATIGHTVSGVTTINGASSDTELFYNEEHEYIRQRPLTSKSTRGRTDVFLTQQSFTITAGYNDVIAFEYDTGVYIYDIDAGTYTWPELIYFLTTTYGMPHAGAFSYLEPGTPFYNANGDRVVQTEYGVLQLKSYTVGDGAIAKLKPVLVSDLQYGRFLETVIGGDVAYGGDGFVERVDGATSYEYDPDAGSYRQGVALFTNWQARDIRTVRAMNVLANEQGLRDACYQFSLDEGRTWFAFRMVNAGFITPISCSELLEEYSEVDSDGRTYDFRTYNRTYDLQTVYMEEQQYVWNLLYEGNLRVRVIFPERDRYTSDGNVDPQITAVSVSYDADYNWYEDMQRSVATAIAGIGHNVGQAIETLTTLTSTVTFHTNDSPTTINRIYRRNDTNDITRSKTAGYANTWVSATQTATLFTALPAGTIVGIEYDKTVPVHIATSPLYQIAETPAVVLTFGSIERLAAAELFGDFYTYAYGKGKIYVHEGYQLMQVPVTATVVCDSAALQARITSKIYDYLRDHDIPSVGLGDTCEVFAARPVEDATVIDSNSMRGVVKFDVLWPAWGTYGEECVPITDVEDAYYNI